jgi:NAD(P)-dependent dehydrogenase (short-subunit alcohol dehydrogenase family)
MDLELSGRVAIVTGGSRGVGRAIAQELAREGADVAVCARSRAALDETAGALAKDTGRRSVPIVADTTNAESVARMVEATLAALGRIDILVNNAATPGGLVRGPLAEANERDLLEDIDTKVVGYLRCAKAVLPHMEQRAWGHQHQAGSRAALGNISDAAPPWCIWPRRSPTGSARSASINLVHPGATRRAHRRDRPTGCPRGASAA